MTDTELMTMQEVVALLRVSRPTINDWVAQGHLRRVKLGPGKRGAVRFRRDEVERLLENEAS